MKMNSTKEKRERKPIVRQEKTRYRIIRLDSFVVVLDCKTGDVWHPFTKAWEALQMIEKIKTEKIKPTADITDFEKNNCFRGLAEAKAEFDGKIKSNTSIDSNLWINLLIDKKKKGKTI